jgi:hypothetical protein
MMGHQKTRDIRRRLRFDFLSSSLWLCKFSIGILCMYYARETRQHVCLLRKAVSAPTDAKSRDAQRQKIYTRYVRKQR